MYRNSEYYSDPTAGKAMANVMREEKRRRRGEYTDDLDMTNWQDLANGIIVQAAEEYRKCLRSRRSRKETQEKMREIEWFFRSDWFHLMTDLDGEMILERLRKEVAG